MSTANSSKDGTAIGRMKAIQNKGVAEMKEFKKKGLSNCENLAKSYCTKQNKKFKETNNCKCDMYKKYPENEFVKSCRETLSAENTSYLDVMENWKMTDEDTLSEEDLKKYNVCGETKEEEEVWNPPKKKWKLSRMFSRGGRRKRRRTKKRRKRKSKRKKSRRKRKKRRKSRRRRRRS